MAKSVELEPKIRQLQTAIETVVRGKPEAIKLALVCLLAEGHLLIEDVPGVGAIWGVAVVAVAADGESLPPINVASDAGAALPHFAQLAAFGRFSALQ